MLKNLSVFLCALCSNPKPNETLCPRLGHQEVPLFKFYNYVAALVGSSVVGDTAVCHLLAHILQNGPKYVQRHAAGET